jgi:hypothetical protein
MARASVLREWRARTRRQMAEVAARELVRPMREDERDRRQGEIAVSSVPDLVELMSATLLSL